MASSCGERGGVAMDIDGGLLHEERCYGLECHAEVDVFAVAYSALYAPAMVCGSVEAQRLRCVGCGIWQEDVVDFRPTVADLRKV